jgi:hypothetical protein
LVEGLVEARSVVQLALEVEELEEVPSVVQSALEVEELGVAQLAVLPSALVGVLVVGHWVPMQVRKMAQVLVPTWLEELSVVFATHGRQRV